jgi:hypothetical protein
MCQCKIQWIDEYGKPTPDNNPAIGLCRTIDRYETIRGAASHHFPASQWFPICAEHAKRLNDRGMHIWEFIPAYLPDAR